MAHLAGKTLYKRLGKKIDSLTIRAPWNDALYGILKTLYSAEEAELVIRMPYGFSTLKKIQRQTGYGEARLKKLLNGLCEKGLVVDIKRGKNYRYLISPMVIGIFEYTMMRTGQGDSQKRLGTLFHKYFHEQPEFFLNNFSPGTLTSFSRVLPWPDAVSQEEKIEILSYDLGVDIVQSAKLFAVGICACRHTREHVGSRSCRTPLDTCLSFGPAAEYLIRHKLAGKTSKSKALQVLARSRDQGLVLSADNVKNKPSFICHCCGCCCDLMLGIKKTGYPGTVVTSAYIAEVHEKSCSGCGKCAKACPVEAIGMMSEPLLNKSAILPKIDKTICLGCGVCGLKCATGAMRLSVRQSRIIRPENSFERLILQALERGTLQNFIFDNPQSNLQGFMRALLGGFLCLPLVKRSLMSEALRSRFLNSLKKMS